MCSETPRRDPIRRRGETQFRQRARIRCKEDLPTKTAATNGWSSTQRVETTAILRPSCRSPILRKVRRSCWNNGQSPQTLRMMSRYCFKGGERNKSCARRKGSIEFNNRYLDRLLTLRSEGVSNAYSSGSGAPRYLSDKKPPHYFFFHQEKTCKIKELVSAFEIDGKIFTSVPYVNSLT